MYVLTVHGEAERAIRVSQDLDKLKASEPEAVWQVDGSLWVSEMIEIDHGPWVEEYWFTIREIEIV